VSAVDPVPAMSLSEYVDAAVAAALHDRSLADLKELLKATLDERDKLYKERDDSRRTAVDAALTAVKEQTKASFEASEKAIVKAEEAQKAYNTSHNDLARKMDEQSKATMPRSETESRFHSLEEKITEIRTTIGTGVGAMVGGKAVKDESRANLALGISVVLFLLTLFALFKGPSTTAAPPPITFVMPSPGVTTTTTQPVPTPLVPR
jgi:hypothetical protein